MDNATLQSLILAIVGMALSAIFTYVPAAQTWYEAQPNRGLIMLGFILLVSLAYFGLSCTPLAVVLAITLTCAQAGATQLAVVFATIALGNQGFHLFTKPQGIAPATIRSKTR